MEELYKKYRPALFKQVLGQDKAVQILEAKIKSGTVPHAILFIGPSGVGKTTLARILKTKLECGDEDFMEINCADFRGIDMVRDIRRQMNMSPMFGKCRIWLIDEGQRLTGEAQDALLKMLEDTPPHVYFILATTNPSKLVPTLRNRCTAFHLSPLGEDDLRKLLEDIRLKENIIHISSEALNKIVEVSEGSARKALILLDQIIKVKDPKDQVEVIQSSDTKRQAIDIARALTDRKKNWSEVAAILRGVEEDPESLRHMILSYATTMLLNGENKRAYMLICCFEGNFFDSGRAGLVRACYECFRKE